MEMNAQPHIPASYIMRILFLMLTRQEVYQLKDWIYSEEYIKFIPHLCYKDQSGYDVAVYR
jgi:hypothetical protein